MNIHNLETSQKIDNEMGDLCQFIYWQLFQQCNSTPPVCALLLGARTQMLFDFALLGLVIPLRCQGTFMLSRDFAYPMLGL